jgi:hypothetical protein
VVVTFAIQDALVTLVALLSAAFVFRRVIGTFAPSKAGQPCANCASGCAASVRATATAGLRPDNRPHSTTSSVSAGRDA